MLPLHLCPVDASKAYSSTSSNTGDERAVGSNKLLRRNLERREAELLHLGDTVSGSSHQNRFTAIHLSELQDIGAVECFSGSRYCSIDSDCVPDLIPLNECILAIAWELLVQRYLKNSEDEVQEGLILLLQSAASFQAKVGSVSSFKH